MFPKEIHISRDQINKGGGRYGYENRFLFYPRDEWKIKREGGWEERKERQKESKQTIVLSKSS